jgi:primosomal protein N' (replication factor Y) (superfamily II helicase)
MYAKVAIPVPYSQFFTYQIPSDLINFISPGMLVIAPFQRQAAIGVVLELEREADIAPGNMREIIGLADPEMNLEQSLLELINYTARYYLSSPGIVLKSTLPPGTMLRRRLYFFPGVVNPSAESDRNSHNFVSLINEHPGRWSYSDIGYFEGITRGIIDDMVRAGIISISPFKAEKRNIQRGKERWIRALAMDKQENIKLGSKAISILNLLLDKPDGIRMSTLDKHGLSVSSAATLIKRGLAEIFLKDKEIGEIGSLKSLGREEALELTLWQQAALGRIESALQSDRYRGFLLYGVTSSGKTQVYLEAAQIALSKGKSVLILVPEISLTPQIISRFERFLKHTPLVWHSHLTPVERLIAFKSANMGNARLLIGTRSAIFSPLKDIGLIVVDEEQDHSYKQDDPAPRYNARDLALERGRISNAVVVLGSATPSVESYQRAKTGELEMLTLPQRVAGVGSPKIELISTAFVPESQSKVPSIFPKGFRPISEKLFQEISIRLKKKEQVIILLNRRGYSSAVVCFECGWVGKCPDCDIGWTYHKARDRMICHYCGREQKGPMVCAKCGSHRLSFRSAGTQRLEETLERIFPSGKSIRLDTDVATRKWQSRDILEAFAAGKFQILFGTQMVAKGHHFPRVTLVGIISADIGLSLPDFRASERVLQLLTQAAGRAGRSSKNVDSGMVLVQTFSPDNPIFGYLKANDYPTFLENELKIRASLGYPPFKRLVLIIISSPGAAKALDGAGSIKDELVQKGTDNIIEVLGPVESPIFKRGKIYRYQLLLKISPQIEPAELLEGINDFMKRFRGLGLRIDVDPVSFM